MHLTTALPASQPVGSARHQGFQQRLKVEIEWKGYSLSLSLPHSPVAPASPPTPHLLCIFKLNVCSGPERGMSLEASWSIFSELCLSDPKLRPCPNCQSHLPVVRVAERPSVSLWPVPSLSQTTRASSRLPESPLRSLPPQSLSLKLTTPTQSEEGAQRVS